MRRADHSMQEKIKDMIEQEPDPRERMRLLILLQISSILVDNVAAVQGLSDRLDVHDIKFDTHVDEESKLINQGRGMWRVMVFALLLAQGAIGYLYVDTINVLKQMQTSISTNSRDLAVMRDRLDRSGAGKP